MSPRVKARLEYGCRNPWAGEPTPPARPIRDALISAAVWIATAALWAIHLAPLVAFFL